MRPTLLESLSFALYGQTANARQRKILRYQAIKSKLACCFKTEIHNHSFDTRKKIWNENIQQKFCQENSNLPFPETWSLNSLLFYTLSNGKRQTANELFDFTTLIYLTNITKFERTIFWDRFFFLNQAIWTHTERPRRNLPTFAVFHRTNVANSFENLTRTFYGYSTREME